MILFHKRRDGLHKLKPSYITYSDMLQRIKLLSHTRLIRFGAVGSSGAVMGLCILWLLTEYAGVYYLASYLISTLFAITNNWYWNSRLTFRQELKFNKWAKYLLACSGTMLLNMALMFTLTSVMGIWYMFSAVIVVGTVFLINYYLSRRFVWTP